MMTTKRVNGQRAYHIEFLKSSQQDSEVCAVVAGRFRLYGDSIDDLLGPCQERIDQVHEEQIDCRSSVMTNQDYVKRGKRYI
jgi:hypothetical protein